MNRPTFSMRYAALLNRAAVIARHEGGDLIERRRIQTTGLSRSERKRSQS